jgi:hypothetical protein
MPAQKATLTGSAFIKPRESNIALLRTIRPETEAQPVSDDCAHFYVNDATV